MKRMINLSVFILFFSFVNLYASSSDKASIIVLDASGSMWGQLKDGRSKIEVAREVMSEYLKKRDETAPLGLVVYGHRKRGDCADIELLSSVKVQDVKKLSKIINNIQPKGKTPLTDALELAVKQIPRTAEEADIILITDGLETCDQDPCALADKIAAEGIDIRAHVVGFGLSEKEVNTLACIPKKTGGKLLRPQSGEELIEALQEVEQTTVKVESTEPSKVEVSLCVRPKKGTISPPWVEFFATNLESNETIKLGRRENADEVLSYLETNLTKGKWTLFVKGELGQGELNTTLAKAGQYEIPYEASKATFTLENLGVYQLGVKQSFFLHVTSPIQKHRQLKVALFPKGARMWKEVIDFSYLFGGTLGQVEYDFNSPKKEGEYQVIVTADRLTDVLAKFDVVYKNNVEVRIEAPSSVEPNSSFPYKVYGNVYRYNRLSWVKDGKALSVITFYHTYQKEGFAVTAPSEKGQYELHYLYKEGKEKKKAIVALTVGEADEVQVETNTTKVELERREVSYTPVGKVLTQKEIDLMMKKIMKDEK